MLGKNCGIMSNTGTLSIRIRVEYGPYGWTYYRSGVEEDDDAMLSVVGYVRPAVSNNYQSIKILSRSEQ